MIANASGPAVAASPTVNPSSAPASNAKAASPAKPYVSVWFNEMVKLAQAGIQDGVMLSFVQSAGTFNLTADQIVYLRDLGVSDLVISVMMAHDFELASGLIPLASTAPLPLTPALPPNLTATTSPAAPSNPPAGGGLVITTADDSDSIPVEVSGAVGISPEIASGVIWANQATAIKRASFPVREGHPVPLTNPILFVNAPYRCPNMVVIQSFR
jgi:hypothetical protein